MGVELGSVLQRFGEMLESDGIRLVHIRNGAGKLEYAMKTAGSQMHPVHCRAHQVLRLGMERAKLADVSGPNLGIGRERQVGEALLLHLPRTDDTLAHLCRRFAAAVIGQLLVLNTRNFNVYIDAVEQGPESFRW